MTETRSLGLAGATNFRDMGGYRGRDGRTVRRGLLFRSNHLGDLTADDLAVIRRAGLRSVIDLRGVEERTRKVCAIPEVTVHSLPIEPSVMPALFALAESGESDVVPRLKEIVCTAYRNFIRVHSPVLRDLFGHLLGDAAPVVLHCTAGKDRTGIASALVLLALGVDHGDVVDDYLLTNRLWVSSRTAGGSGLPDAFIAAVATADEAFFAAAMDTIRDDYGSTEAYLARGLGIGPAELDQLERRYLA